jgi:hypothetical protein
MIQWSKQPVPISIISIGSDGYGLMLSGDRYNADQVAI